MIAYGVGNLIRYHISPLKCPDGNKVFDDLLHCVANCEITKCIINELIIEEIVIGATIGEQTNLVRHVSVTYARAKKILDELSQTGELVEQIQNYIYYNLPPNDYPTTDNISDILANKVGINIGIWGKDCLTGCCCEYKHGK